MAQNGIIDRENELKKNFISAVKEVFGLEIKEEDYEKISAEKFVSLKKALSNINNIVTLKVTNLFIEKLSKDDFVDDTQADAMKGIINSTSANANGYDVEYTANKQKEKNILAEVKCNIPVGITQFGSAQKAGILKDIEGLLNGEKKLKSEAEVGSYFKFMVFMDYEDENHNHNVRDSVETLLKNTPYKVKYYDENCHDGKCQLDNDHVYIIFISSEKK